MKKSLTRPPKGWTCNDTLKRQQWVKRHRDVDYSEELPVPPEQLRGMIEHHVGFTPMPTAVAAPLVIEGDYAAGEFMVPLCTTEGAMVYSFTRGMMATAPRGIVTRHLGQKLSRAPMFVLESMDDIAEFCRFVDKNYGRIREAAESTTRYGKLLSIEKVRFHNGVALDMVFSTGNAAGQNMVTFAASEACRYITERFAVKRCYVESGLNSDKKASRRIMTQGRGHSVTASASVDEVMLKRLLGVTTQDIRMWPGFGRMISQFIGAFGLQLNIANALAAMYLALGQDAACVAENSLGEFTFVEDESGNGVTFVQSLPSLTVGTVGGGTSLPAQRRNLTLLGCDRGDEEGSAHKLAEIICGATLCLELSLFSALISGTFSDAHRMFGRNGGQDGR